MKSSHQTGGSLPDLRATLDILPDTEGNGGYITAGAVPLKGECTLLVEFTGGPLEKYCRFVRKRNPEGPCTFSSVDFSPDPPGIRVGPWPGWRGIPEFPDLTLSAGGDLHHLRVMFWGDEMTEGLLRAVCTIEGDREALLTIHSPDPGIVPRRILVFGTHTVRAAVHPVSLRSGLAGTHPRLLVTPKHLTALRERAQHSHRVFWQRIVSLLDHWEFPHEQTAESKAVEGPERLSAEDRVLIAAWIASIEPDEAHIRRALVVYGDYCRLTERQDFEPLGIDTQSGEVLFVLSLGYDLLVASMSPVQRTAAKRRLWEIADVCDRHLGEERRDYAQAHFLGCGLGLLAFSFLFWEEHPRAAAWAARLRGALDCALGLFPDDGFYPHGMNLWIYEFGFLLRWLELFRTCTGEDLWRPELANASAFRAASLSPDGLYGITMGDPQYRAGGDSWCHFLIASRTGSGVAQWLGHLLLELPHAGVDVRSIPARRRVYEFLFFDPAVVPVPATRGVYRFPDGGQVFVRTASTVFTMRSGPPLGSRRYAAGEYGAYGHSDPANGSFLLYAHGTCVASGPGPLYRRDTALHNVVTFDRQGQIGDSTVWLPDFLPPDVLGHRPEVETGGGRVSLYVDLERTYLPHLGVERFSRAVCVEGGRFVAGVDDVRCRENRSIEWRTHSWSSFKRLPDRDTPAFQIVPGVTLLIFEPSGIAPVTALTEYVPAYPNPGIRDQELVAAVHSTEARFVWCYVLDSDSLPRFLRGTGGEFQLAFNDGTALLFDGKRFIGGGRE